MKSLLKAIKKNEFTFVDLLILTIAIMTIAVIAVKIILPPLVK